MSLSNTSFAFKFWLTIAVVTSIFSVILMIFGGVKFKNLKREVSILSRTTNQLITNVNNMFVPESPLGDGPIHVLFSSSTIQRCNEKIEKEGMIFTGFGKGTIERKSLCLGGAYIDEVEAIQLLVNYLGLKYSPEVEEKIINKKIEAKFTK